MSLAGLQSSTEAAGLTRWAVGRRTEGEARGPAWGSRGSSEAVGWVLEMFPKASRSLWRVRSSDGMRPDLMLLWLPSREWVEGQPGLTETS